MSVFQGNCPYCGTKHVAFRIIKEHLPDQRRKGDWDTFATCEHCMRAIAACFHSRTGETPKAVLSSGRGDLLELRAIFPSLPDSGAPDHTPDRAANFYRQGMENLPRNYDAAGSMFRSALEAGLKLKFPEISGTLKQRIERAADQNLLTPDMAEWANKIRLDGNDAVHGEEGLSREDAESLFSFAQLVFLYLFTLPGMLERARAEAADDN